MSISKTSHSLSGVNAELGRFGDNGGPNDTLAPAIGSPVLGQIPQGATGNGITLCSGADQRGVPRPQSTACDIGAVEAECDVADVGSHISLKLTTFGRPVPAITEKGNLPNGLGFKDNGNGTATISGTPQTPGVSVFTIRVQFGTGSTKRVVKQAFTFTVDTG